MYHLGDSPVSSDNLHSFIKFCLAPVNGLPVFLPQSGTNCILLYIVPAEESSPASWFLQLFCLSHFTTSTLCLLVLEKLAKVHNLWRVKASLTLPFY